MCARITCSNCNKPTWAGCGEHIASVKARVPAGQWCDGRHTAAEQAAAPPSGGLFSKIFGR